MTYCGAFQSGPPCAITLKPSVMLRRRRDLMTSCAARIAIWGDAWWVWKSCGLMLHPCVMFLRQPVYPQIEWAFVFGVNEERGGVLHVALARELLERAAEHLFRVVGLRVVAVGHEAVGLLHLGDEARIRERAEARRRPGGEARRRIRGLGHAAL